MILQQYKIVFAGSMGAGKTEAIRSLSDIPVLSTEALNTDQERHSKLETTVGIDYGEVGGKTAHEPNPLLGTSLMGAVAGLRGQVLKSVSYDVFVGTPLKKPDHYKTDNVTTGFSLNWMY